MGGRLASNAGLAAALILLPPAAGAMEKPVKSDEIAPARDGDIAIRQELEAARKAKTLAAYDLFIARHPGHALAEIARRERAALAAKDC